jgi:hypothetical protein
MGRGSTAKPQSVKEKVSKDGDAVSCYPKAILREAHAPKIAVLGCEYSSLPILFQWGASPGAAVYLSPLLLVLVRYLVYTVLCIPLNV